MSRARRVLLWGEVGFQLLKLLTLSLVLLGWGLLLVPLQKIRLWRAKRAFSWKLRGIPKELREDLTQEFSNRTGSFSPVRLARELFSLFRRS